MQSIYTGLLTNNTSDKIFAICTGLAACSFTLVIAVWLDVASRTPFILIDDMFYGVRSPMVSLFFLTDSALMLLVALLFNRFQALAIFIGSCWSFLLLVETLFDLYYFSNEIYLVCEELSFVLIYSYLLALFYYSWMLRKLDNSR
jgi:hypothetical protein